MKGLADILLASQHKKAVVADCVDLIESHIASRSGLKGIALKTGLSMLKRAKPGFIERATGRLLPEFIDALEPLYQESQKLGKGDFNTYLKGNAQRATNAMLVVADRRVKDSESQTVKSTYARMRGDAERELLAAMPKLSQLLTSYL